MRPKPALLRAAAVLTASTVAFLVNPGPANAVQTDTWGMSAATPAGDYLPEIVHSADGTDVQSLLLVWNRTASPVTVHLSVLSVTPQNDTFAYSPAITGLATGIVLPAAQITLPPRQEARIPVTIREPAGAASKEYAAISGLAQPVQKGPLSVQERLAVIVEATADAHPAATGVPSGLPALPLPGRATAKPRPSGPSAPVVFLGTIGGVLLFLVLVLLVRERRRRDEDVVADAAGTGTLSAEYLRSLAPPKAEEVLSV